VVKFQFGGGRMTVKIMLFVILFAMFVSTDCRALKTPLPAEGKSYIELDINDVLPGHKVIVKVRRANLIPPGAKIKFYYIPEEVSRECEIKVLSYEVAGDYVIFRLEEVPPQGSVQFLKLDNK